MLAGRAGTACRLTTTLSKNIDIVQRIKDPSIKTNM